MLRRIIVAGLSACVLGLTFGFTQTANAQTGDCWFNAATGVRVTMVIPVGAGGNGYVEQRAAYESGHASVPGSGQNYFRDANGNWINSATGTPATITVPVGAGGKGYVEQRAAYESGHASVPGSGQNYFRGPCPPTQTAGLYLGGQPVLVLGGNIGGGWSRNTYSDFATFDGSGAGGGVYGAARFYVQPNFFVGPEAGFMLLDINARNPATAFGILHTDAYLGGQAGVTVQGPGASKINFYTGVDADWSRISVGVEAAGERMSKILGGWSVHGGVEVQPIPSIPTLWLGLDLRHSDVSGTIGGDPTHVRWNMLSLTLSIQR